MRLLNGNLGSFLIGAASTLASNCASVITKAYSQMRVENNGEYYLVSAIKKKTSDLLIACTNDNKNLDALLQEYGSSIASNVKKYHLWTRENVVNIAYRDLKNNYIDFELHDFWKKCMNISDHKTQADNHESNPANSFTPLGVAFALAVLSTVTIVALCKYVYRCGYLNGYSNAMRDINNEDATPTFSSENPGERPPEYFGLPEVPPPPYSTTNNYCTNIIGDTADTFV